MLTNYFTLLALSNYFQSNLKGYFVSEIFSQQKNQICISFSNSSHQQLTIVISCEPGGNYIFLDNNFSRAKKNTINLFPLLINKTLSSTSMNGIDRIITFEFEQLVLNCQLFGSVANVLLVDSQSKIIVDSFRNKKELLNKEFQTNLDYKIPSKKDFCEHFTNFNDPTSVEFIKELKSFFPQIGSGNVAHLLNLLSHENEFSLASFYEEILHLIKKLSSKTQNKIYFYSSENSPLTFSLIPLNQYSHNTVEVFADINDAVKIFVRQILAKAEFQRQKNLILNFLIPQQIKLSKKIKRAQNLEEDLERIKTYEHFGFLLKSNLESIINFRGTSIGVTDFCHQNQTLNIPLESKFTVLENLNNYFNKAKKLKISISTGNENILDYKTSLEVITELLSILEETHSLSGLKKFFNEHLIKLKKIGFMNKTEEIKGKPYRVFVVDGEFEVWVGKSSKDNDELTLHYSKPHDFWFHTRGSSGSHVLLKIDSSSGEPSKKAISQAAALAAYYSKMKNAKNVPVAFTQKKYVRKPKGVPVGTVTIEREKIIFVEPAIPKNKKD